MSEKTLDTETLDALSRVVAITNGKGGVFKTSITVNVAGALGASGMKILIVILDPQGNGKSDLGIHGHALDDQGLSVYNAVLNGTPLQVAEEVRPNVDLIFGGKRLNLLDDLARNASVLEDLPTGTIGGAFAHALSQIAPDYDLILIDTPPQNPVIQEFALTVSRWIVVPTKTDADSVTEGLGILGPRVAKVTREVNPRLEYLGVVITDNETKATRILRDTRARLSLIDDRVKTFDTFIRHSSVTANKCRENGRLVVELIQDAKDQETAALEAIRNRKARVQDGAKILELKKTSEGLPKSDVVAGLADDYANLAREICARITHAETATREEEAR